MVGGTFDTNQYRIIFEFLFLFYIYVHMYNICFLFLFFFKLCVCVKNIFFFNKIRFFCFCIYRHLILYIVCKRHGGFKVVCTIIFFSLFKATWCMKRIFIVVRWILTSRRIFVFHVWRRWCFRFGVIV